jgi:hypothetical protein
MLRSTLSFNTRAHYDLNALERISVFQLFRIKAQLMHTGLANGFLETLIDREDQIFSHFYRERDHVSYAQAKS